MSLINCPDCQKQVSSEAPACPSCGRPLKQAITTAPAVSDDCLCPHCGAHAVGKVRGLQGIVEVLLAGILIVAFLIPGIIYYIYIESVQCH